MTQLLVGVQDVGKSILESYSRVLESLASNTISRIEDIIHVDNRARGAAGRPVPDSPAASNRFALTIPYIPSAMSVNGPEDMVAELWQDSPLHSPTPTPTPTSPRSARSDSSFRDKLRRKKPPRLPQAQVPKSLLRTGMGTGAGGGVGAEGGGGEKVESRTASLLRTQSDNGGAGM